MENKIKRNIRPFVGEKYSAWKFRIRSLLTELNVIYVVDDDTPAVLNDDWLLDDGIARNTIVEYLDDTLLGFAERNDTAKLIFAQLDTIYERKSVATQLAVRKKLMNLKLQGDESLIKHFIKYDELITELIGAGGKMEEADKISLLLLTLPPTYDSVITAIETISEDNMSLAFVKVRLLDQEVKLKAESADTSLKVLQVYNKKPHVIANKHNYFKFKKDNNHKKFKIIKCHFCGKNGHIKRNCYKFLNKRKENQTENATRTVQATKVVNKAKDNSAFVFMTGAHKYQNSDHAEFVLDSGASDHIINDGSFYTNYEDLKPPIKIATAKNGSYLEATKRGSINVMSNMGIKGVIENVLFCEDVPNNLLSVGKLQQAGMVVKFDGEGASIINNGMMIAQGKYINYIYLIKFYVENKMLSVCKANRNITLQMWHERLGHIGKNKLLEIVNKKLAKDTELISNFENDNKLCEACINGKQARIPFNKIKEKDHIKRPLFVVHSDVCGPITPASIDNKNYFVTFIDDFTHYTSVYLLTYKSEVFYAFKDFVSKSQAHFSLKLVHLYCDNGGEYLSNEMKEYCVCEGISYHLTVPRTPQLNGVAERMNRTITEKARAMISGAKLDKIFWGEAVITAAYLINVSPTRALREEKTPYEIWHGKKPVLRFLRIFGATAYVHNKTVKAKFDEKSWKGILTGYSCNGYRVWDPVNERFVVVKDVIFDEVDFMTSRPDLKSRNEKDTSEISKKIKINDYNEMPVTHERIENDKHVINVPHCHSEEDNVRRSERIKQLKSKENLVNEVCALNVIYEPPQHFSDLNNRSDSVNWKKAVDEEIYSLIENETWDIVDTPANKNIVDCKWVFTLKHDQNGNPIRYKARLVAKGFSQKYQLDYDETFAPVARMTSFRILCAFANQFGLLIHQMDVKTAFLNGILKEDIYMKVPEGVMSSSNKVCKLKKALYGLKQAARCWYELFDKVLVEKGFRSSSADRCVYMLDNGDISENIYLVLYVDDVVIITAKMSTMNNFKTFLMEKFKMTDMKDIKFFLGIEVERNNNKICFNQRAYIEKVLQKFNMSECNSVSTPLPNKIDYQALKEDENSNYPCRNLVGCLMYIMLCTRPDLSAAVSILSRYSNKENKELWHGLKRILRYLKGTIDLKLTYERKDFENLLCGFADSDWGSNDDDRRSTSGYLFKMYDNCSICWSTRKQASVAASSTEAEYMALFEATREAKWLKSFVEEIGVVVENPIVIHEDNNGCICIASNPTSHKRSKHVDIKYHFTREQVENKLIKLSYISTEHQIADAMTKPLPLMKFKIHRDEMGLQ